MTESHANARLEAFSDGVFAFALTLLVVDLKLPAPDSITDTAMLWRALGHLAPAGFAFLLSFTIILITWLNHRAALTLIPRTSPAFTYANGFLLLTVVAIPFTASLMGDFLGTDHAAPAVVLYDAVLAVQALGWVLMLETAERGGLAGGERAGELVRRNVRHGYFAFAFYALLALAAFWLPHTVATVTTASWIFWLVLGVAMGAGE